MNAQRKDAPEAPTPEHTETAKKLAASREQELADFRRAFEGYLETRLADQAELADRFAAALLSNPKYNELFAGDPLRDLSPPDGYPTVGAYLAAGAWRLASGYLDKCEELEARLRETLIDETLEEAFDKPDPNA